MTQREFAWGRKNLKVMGKCVKEEVTEASVGNPNGEQDYHLERNETYMNFYVSF